MPNNHRYPRCQPDDNVVIKGRVWNQLVEDVEALSRLDVTPPLFMQDNAGGKLIALVNRASDHFFARITGYVPLKECTPTGRWKYAYEEVVRNELTWTTVTGGRTGSTSCTYGECADCGGDPETAVNFCNWALSMYEGDNVGGAPVAPTPFGTIVLVFISIDSANFNIPRYTFVHTPGRKAGKIVAAGPCSQADYTDPRYWVQIEDATASDIDAAIALVDGTAVPNVCTGGSCPSPIVHIVTATNIPEYGPGTHVIPIGTYVVVDGIYDEGGTVHYIFSLLPPTINVGQFCAQGDGDPDCNEAGNKPDYTTPVPIANLYLDKNHFRFLQPESSPGVVCALGVGLVQWTGLTGLHYIYTTGIAVDAHYCNNTLIGVNSDISIAPPESPTIPAAPAATSLQIPVFLHMGQQTIEDPCACDGDHNSYNVLQLNAYGIVDPCWINVTVTDGSSTGQVSTISVGAGLSLAITGSDCAKTATLTTKCGVTACDLTTDGGSNASTSTGYSTYTYTAKDSCTGATIGTTMTPTWQRVQGFLAGPAAHGFYTIVSGSPVLLTTDEQPAITPCP